MCGALRCALALLVVGWTVVAAGGQTQQPPRPVEVPVTPELQAELQRALADGLRRFEAMDEAGVLANISEGYRSGPLTKPLVQQQLRAMYAAHDAVWARVQIREVRMIGDRAWVSSAGNITGRLRILGTHVTLYSWTEAWEVAHREGGRWKLIGDRG